MTDEQVIKTLECCVKGKQHCCNECPIRGNDDCIGAILADALFVINRQKAEIEALEYDMQVLKQEKKFIENQAIKEFADELKNSLEWRTEPIDDYDIDILVDDFLKE